MLHLLALAARTAIKLQMAAERRQKEKEKAEGERLEALREANDPVYRAQKEASRLAGAEATAKANRREARLVV